MFFLSICQYHFAHVKQNIFNIVALTKQRENIGFNIKFELAAKQAKLNRKNFALISNRCSFMRKSHALCTEKL